MIELSNTVYATPFKRKMGDRFKGGRRSERIKMKYSFSRFRNAAAEPILIDFDDSIEELPLPVENTQADVHEMHEMENMIIDILSPDDPPSVQAFDGMMTDRESKEGSFLLLFGFRQPMLAASSTLHTRFSLVRNSVRRSDVLVANGMS